MRAAEQDRPDVAQKRRRWRTWQRYMDPARFIFLDETRTAANTARHYGRSPSVRRLVAAVPHGHRRTTTFIAGLRQSGVVAPLVLDGAMTGPIFAPMGSDKHIGLSGTKRTRRQGRRISN